jgi:xylulokinase
MDFLGIDVGTSGCKTTAFSHQGEVLSFAYEEYNVQRPNPGWAELDAVAVWQSVKRTIAKVTDGHPDPASIQALSVSSMGEAVVPITRDRQILGPSILNFDTRGQEYLPELHDLIGDVALFEINGNSLGNHYSLTKLLWLRDKSPDIYERADYFLHWSGFVLFMLGGDAATDYSLANRTLLFDLSIADWSDSLLTAFKIDRSKLPPISPSARPVGTLSAHIADELGLSTGVVLVTGAHDQCANAVGCGAIEDGQAAFGMGTYHCIAPVYSELRPANIMLERGLNTEHHAAPGKFVSFIYNPGGALVKWYRDTFAHEEHQQAINAGISIYDKLIAEIPEDASPVLALPHFAPTGPPGFVSDSSGVIVGLRLDTTRADVLKGILEGIAFYLKECVGSLPPTNIHIDDFRVAGGGSQSDTWVQLCADIFERPFVRSHVREAGTLGAAVMAGVGSGFFQSIQESVAAMVQPEMTFEPDPNRAAQYRHRFEYYKQLWPMMSQYLRSFTNERI